MKTLIAFAAVALLASGAALAQSAPSDTLRITLPAAGPVDYVVPEVPATGVEMEALYGFPAPLGSGVYPGGTVGVAAFAPMLSHVVALIEPPGSPFDPSEPLLFNQPVSDLVLGFSFPNPAGVATGVALISDGNPNLASWVTYVSTLPGAVLSVVETGALQDLTLALKAPVGVAVLSDVEAVPEAQTFALFAGGLGLLALRLRRRSPG